jgi:ribose 5-phosphate isomerase B
MKLAIGCDHTGVAMKKALLESVLSDHTVLDVGTDSERPVDYPDFAKKVAAAVATGEVEKGILICGTGIGMAMASGKVPGIRAATCNEPYSATWLASPFDGGRHTPRVEKIG